MDYSLIDDLVKKKIGKIKQIYLENLYLNHIKKEYIIMVDFFKTYYKHEQNIIENIDQFNDIQTPRFMVYTEFVKVKEKDFEFAYQQQILLSLSSQVFTFYYDNRILNPNSGRMSSYIEFISEESYFKCAREKESILENELNKYGYVRFNSSVYDKCIGYYDPTFKSIGEVTVYNSLQTLFFGNIFSPE